MKCKKINIIFDYLGNVLYLKGAWSPKTKLAKFFVNEVNKLLKDHTLEIVWLKATSHTGIELNDEADRLAKVGAMLSDGKSTDVEIINPFLD